MISCIMISERPVNVNIIIVARKGDFRFGRPVGSYNTHRKGSCRRVDGLCVSVGSCRLFCIISRIIQMALAIEVALETWWRRKTGGFTRCFNYCRIAYNTHIIHIVHGISGAVCRPGLVYD